MSNSIEQAKAFGQHIAQLKLEIGKVVVGQEEVVEALINAVFCHGHVLMVGVPGLAKTLLVKTLSETMELSFNRIQFTPDLMPSDIIGSEILDDSRKFHFVKGPIFRTSFWPMKSTERRRKRRLLCWRRCRRGR